MAKRRRKHVYGPHSTCPAEDPASPAMGRTEEAAAGPPPSLVFPAEPRKRGGAVAVDGPPGAAQPPTTPTLTRLEAALYSPYQVINPGIMGGFINPKASSIPHVWFQLHNQTLNIYSHLLAVLLYGYVLASGHAQSTAEQLYCVCACFGWGLSTWWHATSFISEAFMIRGLALDYIGIAIVGGASNVLVAAAEVGGMAPVLAALGALLLVPYILWFHLTRDIRKAKFGPLNAVHSLGIFVFWLLGQRRWPQLAGILLAYATYGISLLIHQSRWPEKWWHSCTVVYSHPIMHVGVALGSLIVYLTYHGSATDFQ